MYSAYCDESGHSASGGHFALAAYVGHDDEWVRFNERWNAALAEAGAPYLHMREFAHSQGPYRGWTEDRRRLLMSGVVEAITTSTLVAVAAAMNVDAYRTLPTSARESLRDPFFCCFQEVVRGVGIRVLFEPPGEVANVVFSRQDEFGGGASMLHDVLLRHSDVRERLGNLRFEEMTSFPGLQAADLLSYEWRLFVEQRAASGEAMARWPIRQLARHQREATGARMMKFLPTWYLQAQGEGRYYEEFNARSTTPEQEDSLDQELFPSVL